MNTTIVAEIRSFNNKGKIILIKKLIDFLWPPLKWILNIEVFLKFIQMVYFWKTPNTTAGWTFILHFSVLTAVYFFISIYRNKK
jgi:hypothetical protein